MADAAVAPAGMGSGASDNGAAFESVVSEVGLHAAKPRQAPVNTNRAHLPIKILRPTLMKP